MASSVQPAPRPNARWFHRHPKKTLLGVAVVIILGLDVLSANVYRAVTGHPFPAGNVERTYRVPSRLYHHDLAVNASVDRALWGGREYRVRTNSLGFKDRTVRDVPLKSDHRRILFIGDSFTEGIGMEYDETFVGRIDTALAAQNVDVLNAGVASYAPVIHWRKIKHLIEGVGLKFDQVVVFIDVSDAEDELDFYKLTSSGRVVSRSAVSRIAEALKMNTILVYSALDVMRNLTSIQWERPRHQRVIDPPKAAPGKALSVEDRVRARPEVGRRTSMWTIDDKLYNGYAKQGIELEKQSMNRLAELLQQHHIELVVAVYPHPDQIINDDLDSRQVKIWRQWCNEHDVPLINYFPDFVRSMTWAQKEETLDTYFIRGDIHWNQKGHALIADVFLQWYKAHGQAAK